VGKRKNAFQHRVDRGGRGKACDSETKKNHRGFPTQDEKGGEGFSSI